MAAGGGPLDLGLERETGPLGWASPVHKAAFPQKNSRPLPRLPHQEPFKDPWPARIALFRHPATYTPAL
jgi:hypothetical protein